MTHIQTSLIALIALTTLMSCGRSEYRQTSGVIWNTMYNITYESDSQMEDSILSALKRVELSVSAFNPNSVVTNINKNKSFATDDDFLNVYTVACEVNKLTDRAFDPTLSPLINLYGFGYEEVNNPDSEDVNDILQYVGIEKTQLSGGKLVKQDARTEFNFSALAKGYGCDAVAYMFKRRGVTNYMIEIGGEIDMSGTNPQHTPWRISIDKPIFSADTVIHDSQMIVELTDCGMATSGNYRNFKLIDGNRVVHTIDRNTGLPAINDMLSATIIVFSSESKNKDVKTHKYPCMYADALATACMSMGSSKAIRLVEYENIAAMLILADGTIYESPTFKKYVRKVQ
ncbi:MAG: FAD:protein FMN transferase [Muribaculaceae bacterium]|nr:FAD:protein FMN transferase [Muribaculaceae bacterium]